MNILVTGGAGYIGSVTVEKLCNQGEKVIVLDTLEEGHRDAVHPEARFIKGDFGDPPLLDRIFGIDNIDVVIHFAAYASVPISMEKPAMFFDNNIKKGIILLNKMIEHGCKKIIFSSSAAVYGEPKEVPIPETHPTVPINPYGETKLMFEKMLKWYHQAYDLQFNAFRYFCAAGASENYGENHPNESHLIPLTIFAALGKREKLYVFGSDYNTKDGSGVRDFVHVGDIADAHILGLKNLNSRPSGTYNLGCNEGYSVLEIIGTVQEVVGRKVPYTIVDRRKGDPAVLIASNNLAYKELGWSPKYSLKEIIQSAYEWHLKFPEGYRN